MTMHIPKRQPFAALDTPRLQTLANIKNRQNGKPIPHFYTHDVAQASPCTRQDMTAHTLYSDYSISLSTSQAHRSFTARQTTLLAVHLRR